MIYDWGFVGGEADFKKALELNATTPQLTSGTRKNLDWFDHQNLCTNLAVPSCRRAQPTAEGRLIVPLAPHYPVNAFVEPVRKEHECI